MTREVVRRQARNGDVSLAYEVFGPDTGKPLLLIMGGGAQMLLWHDDFCLELVRRGFRVARMDNRARRNRRDELRTGLRPRRQAPASSGHAGGTGPDRSAGHGSTADTCSARHGRPDDQTGRRTSNRRSHPRSETRHAGRDRAWSVPTRYLARHDRKHLRYRRMTAESAMAAADIADPDTGRTRSTT